MEIPSAYRKVIHDYSPGLVGARLELNRDGMVNDVVIANRERVFRFPKGDAARVEQEKEARLLDLIRPYLSLPLPVFERLADGVVTYPYLVGEPLYREAILQAPEAVQAGLAQALAGFLRQLHTIPEAHPDLFPQLPPSNAMRSDKDWVQLYREAERELFPLLMSDSRRWVASHFAPLLDGRLDLTYHPALVHGDLGAYHLLVEPGSLRINGVLDFGTLGLGDPAVDFAAIISDLGESFLQRMIPFYSVIDPALDRARFWAGTLEIQWALGGLRTKDPSWFFFHLGRARDVLPFRTVKARK